MAAGSRLSYPDFRRCRVCSYRLLLAAAAAVYTPVPGAYGFKLEGRLLAPDT